MTSIILNLKPALVLNDEQFYLLCHSNPDIRFEQTAAGELVIMSPTGGISGNRNFSLLGQLWLWTEQDGTGVGFDSSTGFKLANGANRSPDAAWIRRDRWETLTPTQQEKFPPIAPDFVIELRSVSDELAPLQAKMCEYCDNGVRLGWLINPQDRQVEIYRLGQEVEILDAPDALSGEEVLPEFVLRLEQIWR
jgi:Uma2 family endonuclease